VELPRVHFHINAFSEVELARVQFHFNIFSELELTRVQFHFNVFLNWIWQECSSTLMFFLK